MRVGTSALAMRGLATAMALAVLIRRAHPAAADDPPFVVLIRINGGEAQLSVPAGADADTVAQEFGRARGLGAEDVSTVARTILAKGAEVSGRRLRYVLPVNLGGSHGSVHLPVYGHVCTEYGDVCDDDHVEVAAAFSAKYGLGPDVASQLVSAMAGQEQRMREAAAFEDGKQKDARAAAGPLRRRRSLSALKGTPRRRAPR